MNFLCFNEAALLPLADPNDKTCEYVRLETYMKTFKAADKRGYKKIRYHQSLEDIFIANGRSLKECIKDCLKSDSYRIFATFLLSTYHYPFIDDNSLEEKDYIRSNFYVQKNGNEIAVHGFAAAYLYTTPAIHFKSTDNFWDKISYNLVIRREEGSEIKNIISISEPTDFENEEYTQWKENNEPVEIVKCNISPEEKEIRLREDHGKDKLQSFSDKIVRSPYVKSVINSLPFNPYQKDFIKNIFPDGKIEIVLTETDRGLGLIVQTTGRNLRETEEISRILESQFG